MDSKFYPSRASSFRSNGNQIGELQPMSQTDRITPLQKVVDSFDIHDAEQVKQLLSVVSKIYNNNELPKYADLARIDREFDLFDCVNDSITYLSINNGPGYFDLYMHSKLSYNCSVIAMSEQPYQLSRIGMAVYPDQFMILVGSQATGDITKEWSSFIQDFERTKADVQFALCCLSKENQQHCCYLNIYLTLRYLKDGHDAVIQIPGDRSPFEQTLVSACASCFHEISIFKPVTSDLFDRSRYLICKQYRKNDIVLAAFIPEQTVLHLSLSAEFVDWFAVVNDEIDQAIIQQYQNAISLLQGEAVQVPSFNQTLIYGFSQLLK